MNILYYDCFSGISGDMNLAALIDLGVDPEFLRTELGKLGLDQEFELRVSTEFRNGIRGTRVDVVLGNQAEEHAPGCAACAQAHAHSHEGREHSHEHGHRHGHVHGDREHAHGHDNQGDHAHVHAHAHTHAHAHAHHHDGYEHAHKHTHEHTHEHGHEHAHELTHGHGHHHGDPRHAHEHAGEGHGHHHQREHAPHRNLADIEAIIRGSGLDDAVKATSLRIFRKVAEAEAKVHGKALHEVHFHEVGATDSIVDIVGAAICHHRLGVDAVWASPVELGGGFVHCAHGRIPVPAPATVEILHGVPTTRGATKHETTTPTGAAILAALVDAFTDAPAMVTQKTGYGVGHREMDIPNVLRVHLARAESAGEGARPVRLLTCNIDDMTGEMLGATMELLMEHGAMDVHFTPIQMKKNRPGTCLSVLCAVADEQRFKDLLFRHTTTLGVKSFLLDKTELERSFERLETPLGPVTVKKALLDGKVLRAKPEFEECRDIARRHGIPLAEVYARIARFAKEDTP